MRVLLLLSLASAACVAPKFLVDIPANSTPQREARYYRTQDAANLFAGAAVDQIARLVWHGPTDHVGQGDRQIGATDSIEHYTFKWRSGMDAPLYRIGAVVLLGGIRRQTDRGYRESGWLFNVGGALLNEWLHMFVVAIRGHL